MGKPVGTDYKVLAIGAARELGYGEDVVAKIKKASTEEEITRIMHDARNKSKR